MDSKWEIVLAIFALLLFAGIVLQIVYIRTSLAQYERVMVSLVTTSRTPQQRVRDQNVARMYALKIIPTLSVEVNNFAQANRIGMTANHTVVAQCNNELASLDVVYDSPKWLAIREADSATNLISDVTTGKVGYLYFDNMLYKPIIDANAVEKLQDVMGKKLNGELIVMLQRLDQSYTYTTPQDYTCTTKASPIKTFRLSNAVPSDLWTLISGSTMDIPILLLGFSAQ
jgi:hypothetical protein